MSADCRLPSVLIYSDFRSSLDEFWNERYSSGHQTGVLGLVAWLHPRADVGCDKWFPLQVREKLAVPEAEWPRAIAELTSFPHIEEAAVLSTCNRMELYIVALSQRRGTREVPCSPSPSQSPEQVILPSRQLPSVRFPRL